MGSDYKEQLDSAIRNGMSWVIWRFPNEPSLHHLGPALEKAWDGIMPDKPGFIFAPFDTDELPIYGIGVSGVESPIHIEAPNCGGKSDYINYVNASVEAIRNGGYKKIVAARAIFLGHDYADPLDHFHGLCLKNQDAFCYLWFSPSTGLWMGASPELLLHRNGNSLETMALAGTQRPDTSFGYKEEEEQDLVTQYIKFCVSDWSSNVEQKDKEYSQSGHLLHLKTRIEASLNEHYPGDMKALQRLSPTPAVAGIPKGEAMQFIREHEGMSRSYYSGFMGTISASESRLFVNLRCLHQLHGKSYQYVGAGITAKSNPEQEWLETVEKAKVVLTR
ncbi:MAG: hypothetical protein GC180_09645 [Bacteroidetes bacterium]|nr:hypothetical protein [Bacteroidota bacterium]